MRSIRYNQASRIRGFTLIEVLIVIGVIAVLISILALGGRAVMKTTKLTTTKTTMQNLVSLQAEYEAIAGPMPDLINSDRYVRADQLAVDGYELVKNNTNHPGTVEDTYNDYHAIYTQRALRTINRNSRVKSSFSKMPTSSVQRVDVLWAPPIPFSTDQKYLSKGMRFEYSPGDVVKYNNRFYICRVANFNSSTTPGSGFWSQPYQDNPNPIFVPLDAWGNPIRYVGATGLDRLKVDAAASKYWMGPDPAEPSESSYSTIAMPDNTWNWLKRKRASPSFRPFWVSAGPDGDFKTDDDNIYSFEN